MFDFSYLDISAALGLCATGFLTLNYLLGMLLSTAYKKSPIWKKLPEKSRQLNVLTLHNYPAYIALLLILLHPLFLFFDTTHHFTVNTLLFPLESPQQKYMVLLGVVSMYAFCLVILTTQKFIKKKLGFRLWKNLHLISYATAMVFILHGLLMDPELKDRPTDWFDAEKLVPEGCLLILVAATIYRTRYYLKQR